MNNYDTTALANHLAHSQSIGGMGPSVQDLPKFLTTSAGKHAVRGVIDSIIARQKTMDINPPDTHTEIIKSLLTQIPGAQTNATPPTSNPMQTMPDTSSNLAPQSQGSYQTPMVQPQTMQSMLGQGSGM